MDIRLRLAMAGLILVAVVVGLMAPVHAPPPSPPAYDGHVYGCDDEPLIGATVLINNTNENFNATVYTDGMGYYFIDANKTYPSQGDLVRVTATYNELSATKEIIVPESGPLTVDFILCKEMLAPVFTSVGILALMGLLAVIAALAIVRKRR